MPQSENQRQLHPAGKSFAGVILDHGFSETKNGASQIFVAIQNAESGAEITAFMSLAETMTRTGKQVVEYTIEKLRRCGFTGFSMAELADGELLKGNEIRYEVVHETFEGVIRDKVGWINSPGSGVERSATAEQNAARFDELLKQNPPENNAGHKSSQHSERGSYTEPVDPNYPPYDDDHGGSVPF